MSTPDMDVIREVPGYKVILKAVIRSQIQQLVEQLANTTDEESVILTASVADGTLCHLGSDSGKVFLEDHEDIKSQFLGFCLKRHHKKKQEKEREKEEMLARSMQPVTPPHYSGMGQGPRFMPQRSPRYQSPQQSIHPVALARASPGSSPRVRSPGVRHQPYPATRPPRQSLSFDQSQGPGPRPHAVKLNSEAQVIKIEPDDDESSQNESVQTPSDTNVQGSSEPSSPSGKPSTPVQTQAPSASDNDDAKSESSTSTLPNETSDLSAGPPGGLSFDSDLSVTMPTSSDVNAHVSSPQTSVGLDPNVSVKLESVSEGDMDLEITGVELGMPRPSQEPGGSQEWIGGAQGAAGSSGDMMGQQSGYRPGAYKDSAHGKGDGIFASVSNTDMAFPNSKSQVVEPSIKIVSKIPIKPRRDPIYCEVCGLLVQTPSHLRNHMRVHTGEKPYVCPICNKGFKRKYHMKTHLVIHDKLYGNI